MRLFLAVDIPAEIRESLAGLAPRTKSARPVPSDNMHVTLKFLGEVDSADGIAKSLEQVSFEPFTARLTRLGVLQSHGQMRVLWAGIEPRERFEELKDLIEKALPEFGKEKRFTPHITVARFKFPLPKEKRAVQDLVRNTRVAGEFEVDEFTLYKSTLTQQAPVYEVIAKFKCL